jgi:hypothetical protein
MRLREKHLLVITSSKPLELAMILETAINLASSGKEIEYIDLTSVPSRVFEFPIADRLNSIVFKIKMKRIEQKLKSIGIKKVINNTEQSIKNVSSIDQELAKAAAKNEVISLKRESNPCLECYKNLYINLINLYNNSYLHLRNIFNTNSFSNVYIYNGRFIVGNAVWNICDQFGIKVKFLEQANMSFPDRYWLFHKPVHSPAYRAEIVNEFHSLSTNQQKRNIEKYAREWFSARIAGVTQNFTANQNKYYKKANNNVKIISYFHSSEDELILSNLKETSWGSQFEIINNLSEIIQSKSEYQFLIRIHPNLKFKSNKEIQMWDCYLRKLKQKYRNVDYFWFDSPINTYSLIESSQIVFTSGSTIGPESAYMGKSNVLCGNSLYSKMEMSYKPKNPRELENNFNSYIRHVKKSKFIENAKKFGYFQMLGGLRYKYIEMNSSATRINFDGITLNYSLLYSALLRLDKLNHRFFGLRRSCYKC